ncbi:MAG: hypothetical protein A2W33_06700 [Chloroflexi bacterium RBG_16_52_11]|nr:MAG: hypothetical protein A2W33_06700 [Chloroflexi bacterium RBG_16_52_11]
MKEIDGFLWLLISTGLLLFLQHNLHQEIQGVFLLLTRRADISIALFSILFFPGILIHESSHYLVARMLRVKTGRFSLIPRRSGLGRLQLGYVETVHTDIMRDALIGAAPLLIGGLVIAYIGLKQFNLDSLWESYQAGAISSWREAMTVIYHSADFWLWLYLAFVISSTMMPSRSDRRAWLPIALTLLLILALTLLAGAGPWLMLYVAPPLNRILKSVVFVFGVSVSLHIVIWLPFLFTRVVLEQLTGLRVE